MRQILPKLIALAVIFCALFFLIGTIADLVRNRENYRSVAQHTITQGTAGAQSLLGPVLERQCTERWMETEDDKKSSQQEHSFIQFASPVQLSFPAAQIELAPLRKGLFTANTFTLKTTIDASFATGLNMPKIKHANGSLTCQEPTLLVAVSDTRGIRSSKITVNEKVLPIEPGTGLENAARGVHVQLNSLMETTGKLPPLQVQMELELAGTSSLAIVPIGEDTQMQLTSNWPHPAFGGRFLPLTREINDQGFKATWRVSNLATSAFDDFVAGSSICTLGNGEEISDGQREGCVDAFQVRFIDPVDTYTLSDRAIKYGLLFVVLTFVAVGMFEILKQLRVHPMQYLLVGCALSIFFLLLLSLGEHLPFITAYAIAASACVLLLTYYASHILLGWRHGLPFGGGIALLYGLLYLLLQMEQNALLAGSIALFVVLAMMMIVTRRLDWYAVLGGCNLRRRWQTARPIHIADHDASGTDKDPSI